MVPGSIMTSVISMWAGTARGAFAWFITRRRSPSITPMVRASFRFRRTPRSAMSQGLCSELHERSVLPPTTASAPSIVMEHGEVGTGCINSRRLPKGKTFIPPRAMYLPMRAALCLLVLLLLAGGAAAAETNRYSTSRSTGSRSTFGPGGDGRGRLPDRSGHPAAGRDLRPGRPPPEGPARARVRGCEGSSSSTPRPGGPRGRQRLDGLRRGSDWFPAHTFGVVVPSLTVSSPQETRQFTRTDAFPRGIRLLRRLGDAGHRLNGIQGPDTSGRVARDPTQCPSGNEWVTTEPAPTIVCGPSVTPGRITSSSRSSNSRRARRAYRANAWQDRPGHGWP